MTTRADFLAAMRTRIAAGRPVGRGAVSARPDRPAARLAELRRQLDTRWSAVLERFRVEFERVGGTFHRVGASAEVPHVVAALTRERGGHRIITWHFSALGFDPTPALSEEGLTVTMAPSADAASPEERDAHRAAAAVADLGLTGADLAVAETGSLVVLSGAGRPRTTSLLPPVHVAVLDRLALVESLEQVGLFLEGWHDDAALPWRGGAINVITGPSRTADIELTLTRGVHGPGEVHAVFVDGGVRG